MAHQVGGRGLLGHDPLSIAQAASSGGVES